MPTIEQLQAAYKAIHGVRAGDLHRLRAAYMFNIEYVAVTDEQRLEGKRINFGSADAGYGIRLGGLDLIQNRHIQQRV